MRKNIKSGVANTTQVNNLNAQYLNGYKAFGTDKESLICVGHISNAAKEKGWYKLCSILPSSEEDTDIWMLISSVYTYNYKGLINIQMRGYNNPESSLHLYGIFGNVPSDQVRMYYDASEPKIKQAEIWVYKSTQLQMWHGQVIRDSARSLVSNALKQVVFDGNATELVEPTLPSYKSITYIDNNCLSSALTSDINSLSSRITTLENFVNQFSIDDNITYAIKNSKPEEICGADEAVIVYTQENAVSLALKSLQAGQLQIDETTDPEIVEEIQNLLGEELFNELATKSVSTLELQPQLSEKEQLKQAIENYYQQKEMELRYQEELTKEKLLEQK